MKHRSNKLYLLLFLFVLGVSLFSALSDMGLLPHQIHKDYLRFLDVFQNPEYPGEIQDMCSMTGICSVNDLDYFQVYSSKLQQIRDGKVVFEIAMIFGTQIFEIYLPFITSCIAYTSCKKYFAFRSALIVRLNGSYHKSLFQLIFKESFKGAFSVFLGYLVFWGIILYWSRHSIPYVDEHSKETIRTLFSDVFGHHLYLSMMPVYFFIEGFLKYFVFTLMFSVLGCLTAIYFQKKKLSLWTPPVYNFGFTIIFLILADQSNLFHYLNPSAVVSGSYSMPFSSPLFFLCFFIPLYISIGLTMRLRIQNERC